MTKYNEFLYDNVGNQHKRRNKYLSELVELQKQYDEASEGDKKVIKKDLINFKKNKKSHPYNVELSAYKKEEKEFRSKLKETIKTYKSEQDESTSKTVKKLGVRSLICNEVISVYEKYKDHSYDALLKYQEANILKQQIPDVINDIEKIEDDLLTGIKNRAAINESNEEVIKAELVKYKNEQRNILKEEISSIKQKYKDKSVSKKAKDNKIKELNRSYKTSVKIKSFDSPKKTNDEYIKNKKHELKKGVKQKLNVLEANISDVRRSVPNEQEKNTVYYSYLSVLLPGLGQLLNKQYIKALLFAALSIFIYMIAIPYALGYGNYRGEGIAGLISLAQNGAKIDKSLIFMIEGIIALYLLAMVLIILLINYKDVKKCEVQSIKGIRPNNWFETKTSIFEDGFPYIVSLPALIVTVFIVFVPITTAILLSFTGMDPNHQSKFGWVGLSNYKLIALGQGLAGSVFWKILTWTIIWTLTATTFAIIIGFFLAILTNNPRVKGKTFFRVIFLLPWAVPAFITIMFFSIMFAPDGAMTDIMEMVFGTTILVKNDPNLSRIVLILIQGWLGSAYVFLLSTGVLQAIPEDLYEAAQIDGATAWQKLRKITIPMVLFQTAPLLVGQYTFNFNNFSIIYLFNGGGPFNPTKYGNLAGSTDLLISYVYKLTMENQYQAIGAAITIVISLGLIVFAYIGFKNSKAFKEERL